MARPWSVRGSHLQHGVWWFIRVWISSDNTLYNFVYMFVQVRISTKFRGWPFPSLLPSWELPTWPLRLSPGVDPATYRRCLWSAKGRRLWLRMPDGRPRGEGMNPHVRVAWFHRWVQQKRLYFRIMLIGSNPPEKHCGAGVRKNNLCPLIFTPPTETLVKCRMLEKFILGSNCSEFDFNENQQTVNMKL